MSTAPDAKPLSADELEIWHALKQLGETAMARVAVELDGATGLSGADFGILTRLEDLGRGELYQHELARSLGWHKARLSHQLTRMEGRGLLRRGGMDGQAGVKVSILPPGRQIVAKARPVHAAAIRAHLLAHIEPDEAQALIAVVRRLGAATTA